jgi:hypothetical protein
MHTLGVKHMQRVKEFAIKVNCFFQRKTIDGSAFLGL